MDDPPGSAKTPVESMRQAVRAGSSGLTGDPGSRRGGRSAVEMAASTTEYDPPPKSMGPRRAGNEEGSGRSHPPAQTLEGVGDAGVGGVGGARRGRVVGGDRGGRQGRGDERGGRQQGDGGDEEGGEQGIALLAAPCLRRASCRTRQANLPRPLAVCPAQRTTMVSSTRRTRVRSAPGSSPPAARGSARPWAS